MDIHVPDKQKFIYMIRDIASKVYNSLVPYEIHMFTESEVSKLRPIPRTV